MHLTPIKKRAEPTEEEEEPVKTEGIRVKREKTEIKQEGGGILQLRPYFYDLNPRELIELPEAQKNEFKKVTVKYQTKKQEKYQNVNKNRYDNLLRILQGCLSSKFSLFICQIQFYLRIIIVRTKCILKIT